MAAPTLTRVLDTEEVWGTTRVGQWQYTGNAAYTAGGDVPPSNLGFRSIRGMVVIGQNSASAGIVAIYNNQTGKIQLFQTGAVVSTPLAEFSGNASTFIFTFLVISIDD